LFVRRRLDTLVHRALFSPLRSFVAAVQRPRAPRRGRPWSLDQASHELREAQRLMNSRIRANTVTPADLDRVASAHQQVLRHRLGL
jgi:hypothetical protein